MIAQRTNDMVEFSTVCGYHAPFARGDRFARMKAEATRISHRSRMTPAIPAAKGTRRVFNDPKLVLGGNVQDRLHVRAQTEQMNGNDSDTARRDKRFNLIYVYVIGTEIDVTEDRLSAHVLDDIRRRHPGECRNDYFVSRF